MRVNSCLAYLPRTRSFYNFLVADHQPVTEGVCLRWQEGTPCSVLLESMMGFFFFFEQCLETMEGVNFILLT